jgi:hypothetical protein
MGTGIITLNYYDQPPDSFIGWFFILWYYKVCPHELLMPAHSAPKSVLKVIENAGSAASQPMPKIQSIASDVQNSPFD